MTDEQQKLIDGYQKRINKHCAALNRVLAEARKEWPRANYYLNSSGLSLMCDVHHDDTNDRATPCPENEIAWGSLNADGGDW